MAFIPGDVVKWLNTEVCKTSIQRFESARRLHFHPQTMKPARHAAACPTCGGPVERPWTGRPPTYCSDACRYGMLRLRRELGYLEAELEMHRQGRDGSTGVRREYHESFYAATLRRVEPLRARVHDVIRPEVRA